MSSNEIAERQQRLQKIEQHEQRDTTGESDMNDVTIQSIPVYQIRRSGKHAAQHAIWDAEQALELRKKHGILGDFVGTLPKHLSQNQFLTLPLLLSDDEVTYGLDKGILHVISDNPSNYKIPTKQIVDNFWKEHNADIQKQVEEAVLKQREERERRTTAVTPRKRKLDEITPNLNDQHINGNLIKSSKLSNNSTKNDNNNNNNFEGGTNPVKIQRTGLFSRVSRSVRAVVNSIFSFTSTQQNQDEDIKNENEIKQEQDEKLQREEQEEQEKIIAEGKKKQKELDDKARHQAQLSTLIVTSTTARNDEVGEREILENNESGIPCPPGMSKERRRRRRSVFDDLRQKGYVMSCGAKFGADFLAYAGDPQLFHAALAVVVVDGHQALGARDIVALGRLGDSTRKRTVLAWVGDGDKSENNKVHYVGVQWEETLP